MGGSSTVGGSNFIANSSGGSHPISSTQPLVGGAGGTTACADGLADCANSGICDTELASSVEHCGSCSNNCITPETANSTEWQCLSSSCRIAQCKTGFGDCDGYLSNGCETDISANPKFCGGCVAHSCAYPVCAGGNCAQTTFAGRSIVPSDPANFADVNLLHLSKDNVLLLPQAFHQGDQIVAFGAVTSLKSLLYPGTFRMALYDDVSNLPNAPVIQMPDNATLTEINGLIEYTLSEPYSIQTSGTYWIAIWALDVNTVNIIIANMYLKETVLYAANPTGSASWPSGQNWNGSLQQYPPTAPYFGFFPSIFVRYVYQAPTDAGM